MKRLLAGIILFSAAAFAAQVSQQSVTGDCNVALGVNQGKVEVQCGLHEGALKPLADKLNKIQKEQKLIDKEVESLVSSVNLLMSVVIGGQDKIIAEIREASGAQTQQLARQLDALAKTVTQQVDRVIPRIPQQGGEAVARFKQEAQDWRKAMTLNNLGNLYRATQRFADAEKAYLEARDLFRKLAQKNPDAYEPDVAMTLNNLGALYRATQRFADAEKAYLEARDLRRKLAQKNPDAYEPDVAMTLNNLGALYGNTQRFADAEKAFLEALGFYKKFAEKNPTVYGKDVQRVEGAIAQLRSAKSSASEAAQAAPESR